MALTFSTFSSVASAEEVAPAAYTDDGVFLGEDIAIADSGVATLQARGTKVVYTDFDLTVYTGGGSARWLHITVQDIPTVPIRLWMEDYSGQQA